MENPVLMTQLSAKDYAAFFEKGISYNEYVANMIQEVENKVAHKYAQYVPMNLQRIKRIGKTTHLGDEVVETLTSLPHTINWLLISEHWCGDVSQTAPIINTFAATSNGMID